MSPVSVIEKFLLRECTVRDGDLGFDSCIVCASSFVWRITNLFPESYIVANGAAQLFPNLATVLYAVKELRVPLIAIVGSTDVPVESFVEMGSQSAEVEFKLLKKCYEENGELLLTMYDSKDLFNSALMELNIDQQIDKLLSLSEFSSLIEKNQLAVCGLMFDELRIYGDIPGFYLTNLNGLKDPEEIRSSPILAKIPESVKKRKVKRIHLQF